MILVEGIIKNTSVKITEFGPVVEEKSFKGFSSLRLWPPFCYAEQDH